MTQARRVGLLGGMFDPIHIGHLDVGEAAARALGLTDVLVVPSNVPPHRSQPVASGHHRFAMAAMAIAGRRGWRVVDTELRQPPPSFSADTLRRFHGEGFESTELFFITGADAFAEIATWRDYPAVLDLAHFAVLSRPGMPASELPRRVPELSDRMVHRKVDTTSDTVRLEPDSTCVFLIDAPTANVSSTAIRDAIRAHRSIAAMVPRSVEQHIEQHRLYDAPSPSEHARDDTEGVAAGRLHGQD